MAERVEPSKRARPLETQPVAARRRDYVTLALLALVALAVYANTLANGFVYDDQLLLKSPLLHEPWNVAAFVANGFRPEFAGKVAIYRPLSDWSLVVNARVSEWLTGSSESAACFHAVNAVLHAAVTCLAWVWLMSLGLVRRTVTIAALLFAVLSIHTEAVANVMGRSELEAALFGLAFLILHRRHRVAPAAIALVLALACKESAIAFVPLAIAADLLLRSDAKAPNSPNSPSTPSARANERERSARGLRWRAYAVYALVAAAWLALRAYELRDADSRPSVVQNPLCEAPLLERVLTASRVQLDYVRLELVPIELSSDYSANQIPLVTSVIDARFLAFVCVLAASCAVAWRSRHRSRAIPLAVLGYAILFSTTSNYLVPIGTIMGERLAYAPSLFFCLALAAALVACECWIGARGVMVATGVLALAYGTRTFAQNRVWRDEITLFAEQARTAPESAKAHAQYANVLAELGRDREAVAEYERSLAIRAYNPDVYFHLGDALTRLREDPEKRIAAYRGAIALMPDHLNARAALAFTLIRQQRWSEARAEVDEIATRGADHWALPDLRRKLESAPR
jgi:tetratricopeptide (TPR) repeat protein